MFCMGYIYQNFVCVNNKTANSEISTTFLGVLKINSWLIFCILNSTLKTIYIILKFFKCSLKMFSCNMKITWKKKLEQLSDKTDT